MNWSGKRVLVTGGGGFIGSHLTERLVELGAATRALVHYNAMKTQGWLSESAHRDAIEIVAADITDVESTRRAVQQIDIVFHLAALIGIPYSYRAPRAYMRTNIEGTINILQAARDLGTQRVIHTSTSEVYGTPRYVPIDEKHPLQGQSPYSASKIGADKMAEAYYSAFDVPVVTVRPFNAFGPRQSTRAVIPTIITQCLVSDTVKLGKLTPTRDFNYVSTTVDGFVAAAEAGDAVLGQTFNIGSGREISIGDLAQLIADLVGRKITIETEVQRLRPTKSEVDRLLADSTRARELLGWEPRVTLEEGLRHTIAWIREHLTRFKPDVYAI